jgi:hypothetical protein
MTWGEFKKHVEANGVTDDQGIWYIDIWFPETSGYKLPQVTPQKKIGDGSVGLRIST